MELRSLHQARRVTNGCWELVNGISNLCFIIKPYQRGYRWEKSNVRKLLDDIYDYVYQTTNASSLLEYIASTCSRNDNTDIFDFYCLQALSIKKVEMYGNNSYELIDGQQRLTTLFLIYEMMDTFINSREDRAYYNAPYSIIYSRGQGNPFDLTSKIHEITMSAVEGSVSPKGAYLKGFRNRDVGWLDAYKRTIVTKIRDISRQVDIASLTIDLYYISNAVEEILDFIFSLKDDERSDLILNKLFSFIRQNVLFLWYEVPEEVSPETEFSSLNSNKIKLTNAELIKALILKADDNGKRIENAGHRWETIEQGLCNSELWAFVSGEDKATRIDLILELYARTYAESEISAYVPNTNNEYSLFDWYERRTNNNDFSCDDILKGVEGVYDRICEWYEDVDIYHYIGLLTCYRKLKLTACIKCKTQEELLKHIYELFDNSANRAVFIEALKKLIWQCIVYKFDDEPKTFSEFIDSFSYDETEQQANLKAILWLLNVWETIEASENNSEIKGKKERKSTIIKRLPFSRINGVLSKKEEWTLEHIMPQNPDSDASEEDKKNYEALQKAVKESSASVVSGDDIHKIGNMALLTRRENSAIQNGNLDSKRNDIIKKIGEGRYVPGATINAFCLYYYMLNRGNSPDECDNRYWTINDRDAYLKQIEKCVRNFWTDIREDERLEDE